MRQGTASRILLGRKYDSVWESETGNCVGISYLDNGNSWYTHEFSVYKDSGEFVGSSKVLFPMKDKEEITEIKMWTIEDVSVIGVKVSSWGSMCYERFVGGKRYDSIILNDERVYAVLMNSMIHNYREEVWVDQYKKGIKIRSWASEKEGSMMHVGDRVYRLVITCDVGRIEWGYGGDTIIETNIKQVYGEMDIRRIAIGKNRDVVRQIMGGKSAVVEEFKRLA
jgi:hypothetical protein